MTNYTGLTTFPLNVWVDWLYRRNNVWEYESRHESCICGSFSQASQHQILQCSSDKHVRATFPVVTRFDFLSTGKEWRNWRVEGLKLVPLFSLQGYFSHTLMYYGYYSNFTLNDPYASSANSTHCRQSAHVHLPYNMPLAYVFVMGISFFATCILLVYRWGSPLGLHGVEVAFSLHLLLLECCVLFFGIGLSSDLPSWPAPFGTYLGILPFLYPLWFWPLPKDKGWTSRVAFPSPLGTANISKQLWVMTRILFPACLVPLGRAIVWALLLGIWLLKSSVPGTTKWPRGALSDFRVKTSALS